MRRPGYHGYVDVCHQSHVAGWAARGSEGVPVSIRINGRFVGEAAPYIQRPDLAASGVKAGAGFMFYFPEPLRASDTIEVQFPDGSHLHGSPSVRHKQRLQELLDGINVERMQGMEMGPLDRPILSKRTSRVFYVDHETREDLIRNYEARSSPEILNYSRIVPVDIVWPGGTLKDRLPGPLAFDYCLASHVIEHVPDVIGWIREVCSVLRPGGLLSLAIPDKQRTFDFRRATAVPADLIDAFVRGLTRPSPRQVFDHVATVTPIAHPADISPERIRDALAHARAVHADSNHYVDVHCHVFTQQSFLAVFELLSHTGLLPVKLRRFFPTRPGTIEFIVSLEVAATESSSEIAATYRHALAGLSSEPPSP